MNRDKQTQQLGQRDQQGRLTEFLKSKGIHHFSGLEVVTLVRAQKVADVPPESWWPRIIPALRIAEHIREQLGHPLAIGNGYRSPRLNRAVGGARRSQHLRFRAIDLDLPAKYNTRDTQELLYRLAGEIYLTDGHLIEMGLGVYRPHRGPRVHIDCGYRHRCWGGKRKRFVLELLAELR